MHSALTIKNFGVFFKEETVENVFMFFPSWKRNRKHLLGHLVLHLTCARIILFKLLFHIWCSNTIPFKSEHKGNERETGRGDDPQGSQETAELADIS